MITALEERFPELPGSVLWKTELLFRGVRYTEALKQAAEEGAAPNFWPYAFREGLKTQYIPVPYLFRVNGGAVARVRVDDRSEFFVRRKEDGRYVLRDSHREACEIDFVKAHKWQSFRTSDGASQIEAGVEQLGDMLVVNMTPGCEYFRVKDDAGQSHRCSFCAYGRFGARSTALGQVGGRAAPDPTALKRLHEVLAAAVESGEARHVYLTGGSMLDPALEVERFLPIVETARRAVGDRLRVTCGSGAVDPEGSRRYRDAGADSCCYNLETWDAETFRTACSGKSTFVGRERWIDGLLGAVEVFGRGNVGSAFVAGIELLPPAPGMPAQRMIESIVEGATFLMDRGITPLYSPLWPVDGTAYGPADGLSPELFLRVELEVYRLRAERNFPVPSWLICRGCSYMLLEVDFDHAFGLTGAGLPDPASAAAPVS